MTKKYISKENLIQYHNMLMNMLKDGKIVPINICPNCGGLITLDKMECEYCGAKFKLTIDS